MENKRVLLFLISWFSAMLVFGQQETDTIVVNTQKPIPSAPHGFIDLNGYYDSRKSSDFTTNLLVLLNPRTSYFTFTNFSSAPNHTDQLGYYSEHHLYRSIASKSAFDFSAQWMTLSGDKNDAFRLGLRWRVGNTNRLKDFFARHNFSYNIAFHLLQADGNKNKSPFFSQVEHFYRKSWLNNRVYLTGFADMDVNHDGKPLLTVVTEHQLGVRIAKGIYAVAEYRYNQYVSKKQGFGFGLEYFIPY